MIYIGGQLHTLLEDYLRLVSLSDKDGKNELGRKGMFLLDLWMAKHSPDKDKHFFGKVRNIIPDQNQCHIDLRSERMIIKRL